MRRLALIVIVLFPLISAILVIVAKRHPVDEIDRRALALFNAGDLDGAISTWEEGLKIEPNSVLLLNRIGVTLTQKKDYSAAEATFLKALRVNPDHAQTHFNLGLLYLRLGREDQAEGCLKEALRCAPWYPETHYHLGIIYEKQGREDLAEEEYVAELNVNPACAKAWQRHFIIKDKAKPATSGKVTEK